jgi:tetratricopeptide (TPR) repeat protein
MHRYRWAKLLWTLLLATLIAIAPASLPARAESASAPTKPDATSQLTAPSPTFNSLWEKLDRIREDRQLQRLVEDDLEKGFVIRSQIQEEVDRAFSHTTALINVMLGLLTFIPVLSAVGIWFIRRSVIGQIAQQTKQQLVEEVEKQFEQEIAAELKQQAAAFKQEIDQLRAELAEKLATVQSSLPVTVVESTAPPASPSTPQIAAPSLTAATAPSSSASPSKSDAGIYVEQGNALSQEGCFDDAIAFYEKALQLESRNPAAWLGKGAALGQLQQFEAAIAAYDQALQLNPDDFAAWMGLARCYAQQGNDALLVASLQRAMALDATQCRALVQSDPAFAAVREPD